MKTLFIALAFAASSAFAQDCHSDVDKRGDHAMGFSHEKTTHHFLLGKSGGVIEITANDASDEKSIASIQGHMRHIVQEFAKGNYEIPMFIHDRIPPGVEVMRSSKELISFNFEELKNGAKITISSKDAEVLGAIHEFLKFQITDHRTGDPTEVP